MAFSPLADMSRRIPDGGRSSARKSAIKGFTIHHNAGVDAYGEATNPAREVSANYWITDAGVIIPQIDESRRAWTSGSASYPAGAASDHRNITVEVSNTKSGVKNRTWEISEAAEDALVRLIGDVFKRHNLGTVKRGQRSGVGVHRDFVPSTTCPGPYIMGRLDSIIARAEQARTGAPVTPSKPAPTTPATPTAPTLVEWPGNALLVDGDFGPVTRRAYQRLLAGSHLGSNRYTGLIDGVLGSMTVIAEQRWLKGLGYYRGVVDGKRGKVTVKALQSFLRAKGHYAGAVDGDHGKLTTQALQRYLNVQRPHFQ